jgi:hypothetical protein
VYRRQIFFFYNWTYLEYKKHLKKVYNYDLTDPDNFRGEVRELTKNERSNLLVYVQKRTGAIDTLVHECIHLKNFIFRYAGVMIDPFKDEHESYYVQMLFRKGLGK